MSYAPTPAPMDPLEKAAISYQNGNSALRPSLSKQASLPAPVRESLSTAREEVQSPTQKKRDLSASPKDPQAKEFYRVYRALESIHGQNKGLNDALKNLLALNEPLYRWLQALYSQNQGLAAALAAQTQMINHLCSRLDGVLSMSACHSDNPSPCPPLTPLLPIPPLPSPPTPVPVPGQNSNGSIPEDLVPKLEGEQWIVDIVKGQR